MVCGSQSRVLKEMEKEREKLLGDLEIEQQRRIAAQQQHLVDLKKLEEKLRDEILKLTTASEKEKAETLEMIENVNISATKISELQLVILGQEKEKAEFVNQQKEVSQQAELKQKHAEKKTQEMWATVEMLKKDLNSMNISAKQAQIEIDTMVEERDKTSAKMKIVHQKLDNAVGLSVNHEEMLQKTAASMDDLELKVENLVMQLAKQNRKNGKMKSLLLEFRRKVECLESSLTVEKETGSIQLSQLKELKENIVEKDKNLLEQIKKKAKLEVQLKNLSSEMDLMKKNTEKDLLDWQAAKCELQSQVYLLTAASESIWSEMEEKLETAEKIREVLSAQVKSRDQFITAQRKVTENWMITMADEKSTLIDTLCKKNDIIDSTLEMHMKKVTGLYNDLVKLKWKFVENQNKLAQQRKVNVGLKTTSNDLNATVESLNAELSKKNNIILESLKELLRVKKSRDSILAQNSSLEDTLDIRNEQVSGYSKKIEEMNHKLQDAYQKIDESRKRIEALDGLINKTYKDAEEKVNKVQHTLKREAMERGKLEIENKKLITKLEETKKQVLNLEKNNVAMVNEFKELTLIAESAKDYMSEQTTTNFDFQRKQQQDGAATDNIMCEGIKSLKDDLLLLAAQLATSDHKLKNMEIQNQKCVAELQKKIEDITSKNVKLQEVPQTSFSNTENCKSKDDGFEEEQSSSLSKITRLKDVINEQTEKLSTQNTRIEDLLKHGADMEKLSKSLELQNETQKESAVAVEKLEKQLTSRKKTFDDTRDEFQRKLEASELRVSDLQASVDSDMNYKKCAEAKIKTLEASLRFEKQKCSNAFANISQLKLTLKEQVSMINDLKTIISKYKIHEDRESVVNTFKKKNYKGEDVDATFLPCGRNGEHNARTTTVDNDSVATFLKKDLKNISGVKDIENECVHKKPSWNSAMSTNETGDTCPKLSSAMSLTDDCVN